ncbi:MAG: SH3 domain-containing protein [Deltaproteobacteria bacterium]|nr:SH3 domain-containing protein [Deltaproteobacteria bacterium]
MLPQTALLMCSLIIWSSSALAVNAVGWTNAITGVNLRAAPTKDAAIVALVPYNSKVQLLADPPVSNPATDGTLGKRRHVQWNDKNGWLFTSYLSDHDLGISAADPFFQRIAGLYSALQKKLPLASFISANGFTFSYKGSDRCEGGSKGQAKLNLPTAIDQPFAITLTLDGHGWEEGCRPRTQSKTIAMDIPKLTVALLSEVQQPAIDPRAHTFAIQGDAAGEMVFTFSAEAGSFAVTQITYTMDDPG